MFKSPFIKFSAALFLFLHSAASFFKSLRRSSISSSSGSSSSLRARITSEQEMSSHLLAIEDVQCLFGSNSFMPPTNKSDGMVIVATHLVNTNIKAIAHTYFPSIDNGIRSQGEEISKRTHYKADKRFRVYTIYGMGYSLINCILKASPRRSEKIKAVKNYRKKNIGKI